MRVPFVDHLSRRSQLILLGSGAAIAFASLLLLTGSVLFRDNAPPAGWKARDIPLTDLNPYGAHFFLDREVEEWKRQKTVEMARQAGLAWARQSFLWEEIEPTHGEFDWAKYDSIVNLYRKNGLDIIARLDRPPSWARKNATASGASGPPDNINDYGDFIEAFARHYSGQIYYFQIWNEPNGTTARLIPRPTSSSCRLHFVVQKPLTRAFVFCQRHLPLLSAHHTHQVQTNGAT
jgi:hypothetical protein